MPIFGASVVVSIIILNLINKKLDIKAEMAEQAFAEMLQDPERNSQFDLHKIERDSKGVEKTMKVDKEQVA